MKWNQPKPVLDFRLSSWSFYILLKFFWRKKKKVHKARKNVHKFLKAVQFVKLKKREEFSEHFKIASIFTLLQKRKNKIK